MSLGAGAFEQIGGRRLAGKKQDLTFREKLADVNRGVDTVHVGHDHVADHQVRTLPSGPLNCCRAGIDRGSVKSILIENDRQGIGDHTFVVDHKHFRLLVASHGGDIQCSLILGKTVGFEGQKQKTLS